MGKAKYHSKSGNNPGPGNYDINKTTLNNKGGTIQHSTHKEKKINSPGVGDYNIYS